MLIQFSIFPTGGAESVSGEVSKVIDIIDKCGLPYRVSAMSTVIEGEWDQIMPIINKCRMKLRENNRRVYMVMTMDDRADANDRLEGKIKSLEQKLNRKIKS